MFISDRLSGTHNGAIEAAQGYKGMQMEMVDTKTGSLELAVALDKMLEHVSEGFERMITIGKRVTEKERLYFSVEGLEALRDSGRLPVAKALLASLLSIKPILSVGKKEDGDARYGHMYDKEKIRASSVLKTLPRLVEYAQKAIESQNSSTGYAYVLDLKLKEMADRLYSKLLEVPIFEKTIKRISDTTNVMYTLVGPAVAVAALPADFI
jgi:fatty acid-binding protein DegV